eukprot:gene16571-20251_t
MSLRPTASVPRIESPQIQTVMRVLGRWMRMITIPNQSSVAKAYDEFDAAGRMKPSAYYDRVVDVMEELVKFTLLTRPVAGYLTDRYSERKTAADAMEAELQPDLEVALHPPSRPTRRWQVISALGVMQIFTWGSSYYLLAVLAAPIAADTGWPLPWIFGALSAGLLVAGFSSPWIGARIGRSGGRVVLAG